MFLVDPDIRRAKTLSSEFYTDERYFELSKEKIFVRTWQYAGGPEMGPGLTPFVLLQGFLDEPLVLSQKSGEEFCLTNVCTHRGNILVENACDANLIRCGYHGRRFSLDGKFLSMPEFDDVADFPSAADDLTQVSLGVRSGFRFVSVDPAAGFDEFVGETAVFDEFDAFSLRLVSTRDYDVNAHWTLYCENYLEGFHIPYVHRSLNEIVDYGTYATEMFRYSSLQTGFDADGSVAGRYLFIFPNTMFNFYPWGISVNVVEPVSTSSCRVRFLTYVADESKTGVGAGADLDRVELEDEAVVESVQKGIRSRFYTHGRYSPTREKGTHHFHRLIAEFLSKE